MDIRVKGKDEASASELKLTKPTPSTDRPEILPELILELGEAKIGTLPKDKPSGKIVDEWNQACVSIESWVRVSTDVQIDRLEGWC